MADLSVLRMTLSTSRRPWWDIVRRSPRGIAAYRQVRRTGRSRVAALGMGWFVMSRRLHVGGPR